MESPKIVNGSNVSNYLNKEIDSASKTIPGDFDILCFSHLRWNFVFQRPQHLLTRFASSQRVYFIEEPIFENIPESFFDRSVSESGVNVCVPHISESLNPIQIEEELKNLIIKLSICDKIENYLSWYYNPMALTFTRHLKPKLVVYDCMDELSAFKFAPENLVSLEDELIKKADLMFTGGMNLYAHKKNKHKNIHGIPSSIDKEHFEKGPQLPDPNDQASIPHPRIGFYGVIDERMDIELLDGLAKKLKDWHIVIIGPVVKIDPNTLPKYANLHYLGGKSYHELPAYLGNWDVAMLPFALNESTKFISPTKTPEYLAAHRPVVSTSIIDVVNPYGNNNLVHIADDAENFAIAVRKAFEKRADKKWKDAVDDFLAQNSWDKTWSKINTLIYKTWQAKVHSQVVIPNNLMKIQTLHHNGFDLHTNGNDAKSITKKAISTVDSFRKSSLSTIDTQIEDIIKSDNVTVGNASGFDYLIVGAGFAGCVLAERLAKSGKKIVIIDKREHIGGNAYDCYNDDGILIHKYGPHIFHTNSLDVFEYLSRFTKWRNYEHRVLASVDGMMVPMPINLDTINNLYGFSFNSSELDEYFESVAEHPGHIITSEDVVVSKVGRSLYDKFFKNYTKKQWGLDPSELNASVAARVPVRSNRDNRYFTDKYQAMPMNGYTKMFQNMLNHPNIKIMLNTDYKEVKNLFPYKEMIYTGPIDEYFGYKHGKLPYRSLEFVFETFDTDIYQKTGTINFPNEHLYTRITEFKYLTGQKHHKTSVVYEFPKAEGDPYYPIPREENNERYRKYEKLAQETTDSVIFVGRLATYKYYNMDQVVAQALSTFEKIKKAEEVKKTSLV